MKKATYLTKQGLLEAKAELDHLTNTYRQKLMQSLKDTRPVKSLTEGDDCDRIKEEILSVEKRIFELKTLLNSAVIVEKVGTNKVSVGNKIKLKFLSDNKTRTYHVVGTHEANPFKNRISNESPIVQAILGKKVNEIATVSMGLKEFNVKILAISV